LCIRSHLQLRKTRSLLKHRLSVAFMMLWWPPWALMARLSQQHICQVLQLGLQVDCNCATVQAVQAVQAAHTT